MGCDGGKRCLNDDIYPHLREPRRGRDSGSYSALAPCHEDSRHSLTVSVGARGIVWCCHTCLTRLGRKVMLKRTRQKLIEDGVPARCLPIPADEARDLEAEVRKVIFGGGSRTHGWLLIAALLEGYDDLPGGGELEVLAEAAGVSRREAFKARAALHPITGTQPGNQRLVKPRRPGR